jgi:membrane protein DedA with SNARE-associated domain
MGLTEFIVDFIVDFIGSTGYTSIVVLMIFESMVLPVPSEAVMPFAGFLIAEGKFSFILVALFSTLGSIIGSLISYYIGALGCRPLIERFGKYVLLDKHHLALTEQYFKKRGDITILISRFIPVVRHLISIPAGIGKMNIVKFLIYTIIGAGTWNAILAYSGYLLRTNWTEIMKYGHIIDIVIIIAIAGVVVYGFLKLYKNYRSIQS